MDVKGQRILIFGDSLTARNSAPAQVDVTEPLPRTSSSPGDLLASWLLAAGAAAVRLDARVGRSAWNFWQREDAKALLAGDLAWRPTLVIVWLGTNDIGLNLTKDRQALEQIRDAFTAVGAKVIGVGPPAFAIARLTEGTPAVLEMHRRVFGPAVIDARPLSQDLLTGGARTGDGVHFTAAGASALAPRLAQAVLALTDVPLRPSKIWKPLGWGFGITLGLGAVVGGLVWVSRRRTQLGAPKPGAGWVSTSDGKPPKLVNIAKLFVGPRKLEETIVDVREGRPSYSKYEPIVVSRLESGDFYILDGHHRLVERIADGETRLPIVISRDLPRIERTGGAYADMLRQKIRAIDSIPRPLGGDERILRMELPTLQRQQAAQAALERLGWTLNAVELDEAAGTAKVELRRPRRPAGHVLPGRPRAQLDHPRAGSRRSGEDRPAR